MNTLTILYGIVRWVNPTQRKLLLEYTSLNTASKYMKDNSLKMIFQDHFKDTGLVIWYVE